MKQQADQLELLELSQLGADIAGKQEAERAHLAAKHSKEREAASKKASSAVLAAQQRRDYEVEQLTRRHQASSRPCRTGSPKTAGGVDLELCKGLLCHQEGRLQHAACFSCACCYNVAAGT